jgi:hypothetical protein
VSAYRAELALLGSGRKKAQPNCICSGMDAASGRKRG